MCPRHLHGAYHLPQYELCVKEEDPCSFYFVMFSSLSEGSVIAYWAPQCDGVFRSAYFYWYLQSPNQILKLQLSDQLLLLFYMKPQK